MVMNCVGVWLSEFSKWMVLINLSNALMQSIWLSLYYIRCIAAAKRCITIARSLRVRVYWLDCLSLTNCYCAQVDNPSVISSPTAFCLSSTLYTVYKSPGTALEPANWISLTTWKCLLAKKKCNKLVRVRGACYEARQIFYKWGL